MGVIVGVFVIVELGVFVGVSVGVLVTVGVGVDEVSRVRKLFLRKNEIKKIYKQVFQKGFTCVPLDVHWSRNIIKINLGVVREKKNWDKRESVKERELNRSLVTGIEFF